jgi:murein DD-endopeptidase MepM/ murein hydrolase activator NlpD
MRFLVPTAAALVAATALAVAALHTAATPVTSASAPLTGSSAHAALAAPAQSLASPPITAVPSSGDFTWPLAPRPRVFRRFVQPLDQWSRGHRGVDLLATAGQPVLSAGNGVVAFSGVIAGRGVIAIRHDGELRTTYEPVDERLTSGTLVRRGSRIGVVSPTPGHCAPLTCLHWGAISAATYRDPLSLLGFGRPVLLPLG